MPEPTPAFAESVPSLPEPKIPSADTTSSHHTSEGTAVPLSKNAQKKAKKVELMKARKAERRVREREGRKEKKRKRAERIAAGEEVSEDEQPRKRAKSAPAGPKTPFDARVLIDLGFDEKMSDKEVGSLISQLAYSYSVNRRSRTPFTSILFTSLNGRTKVRMDQMNDAGYSRWAATEWWEGEFDNLWAESEPHAESIHSAPQLEPHESEAPNQAKPTSTPARTSAAKTSVVYLTADSSDVLEELKEGETYIIGGICDHNRYKNLCLEKANQYGIRAAQLPIGRYLQNLPTRKVLTVNQVFEILIKWVETRDWEEALYSVIPKRKFQQGKGDRKSADGDNSEAEGDDAVDDHAMKVPLEDVER